MRNDIEYIKMKRVLNVLDNASGDGTSLITILIKEGGSIDRMKAKLRDEVNTANNIKSRV